MLVPKLRFKREDGTDYPEWEEKKLHQLVKPNDKVPVETSKYRKITIGLRLKGVSFAEMTREMADKRPFYLRKEGEIIVGKQNYFNGSIALITKEFNNTICSNAIMSFMPNDSVITFFLLSAISNDKYLKEREYMANGTGQKELSEKDFLNFSVAIPCLEEQQKIADFLSTVDEKIAVQKDKLAALKIVKKGMLQKMFPKQGEFVPELRFPGFTGEWEQRKLKNIASSFEYGLNAAAKEFDGINKYLRITDIDDSSRAFKDDDLTSPDTNLSVAENYRLLEGDLLFARTGASVGKSFIYRESDGLVYFAGFLIRARIKPEYSAEFVFQNTLASQYAKYIQITSQRSGQPGVNAQEYGEYSFLIPDYSEQKKIGDFLHQIDTLITLHQRKLETWETIKKGLMQRLFAR